MGKDSNRKGFTRLDVLNELWPDVSAAGLKMLLALRSFCFNGTNECYPSHASLSARSRYSPRQVKRLIEELRGFGLVTTRERKGSSCVFTLHNAPKVGHVRPIMIAHPRPIKVGRTWPTPQATDGLPPRPCTAYKEVCLEEERFEECEEEDRVSEAHAMPPEGRHQPGDVYVQREERPMKAPEEEVTNKPKSREKKPPKKTDPRIKSLIDYFATQYEAVLGEKYHVVGGRDGTIFKRLLSTYDEPKLKACIDAFLVDQDPFLKKAGHTANIFTARIAGYLEELASESPARKDAPKKLHTRPDYYDEADIPNGVKGDEWRAWSLCLRGIQMRRFATLEEAWARVPPKIAEAEYDNLRYTLEMEAQAKRGDTWA
jgi:hypothetical protein